MYIWPFCCNCCTVLRAVGGSASSHVRCVWKVFVWACTRAIACLWMLIFNQRTVCLLHAAAVSLSVWNRTGDLEKCVREKKRAVETCSRCSPGFPRDGGSWLWPVWRCGKGQLPNWLPEDCGRHGTSSSTDLKQRWGATSPLWSLCPPNATWTWTRDRRPTI